jgi:hypothetical protein
MGILTHLFKRETISEKIHRLNFLRQEEVRKWEESSPDSGNGKNWILLDYYGNHTPISRPPRWVTQLAESTWDTQRGRASGMPIFLHRRFVTYKIDYDDHFGYIISKGLKPPSITRIDAQLQQLHRKARYERS